MIFGYDTLVPYLGGYGHEDENGEWVVDEAQWGDEIPCDAEQSGQANIINYEGGGSAYYTYSVTIEADARTFVVGDVVKLSVGGMPSQKYTVKGYRRFRTLAKVWL